MSKRGRMDRTDAVPESIWIMQAVQDKMRSLLEYVVYKVTKRSQSP